MVRWPVTIAALLALASACGVEPAVTAESEHPVTTTSPVTTTTTATGTSTTIPTTTTTPPSSTSTTIPTTTTTPPTSTSTTIPTTTTTSTTTTTLPPTTTSCTSVAHIGDSTSFGMDNYFGWLQPGEDIATQYARVGVEVLRFEPDPGRSIVERRAASQLNGVEIASRLQQSGFRGCWVIALGTNDAANIGAGSNAGARERVERMLAVIGDDPVMWVNVITTTTTGPWARHHMVAWNAAITDALSAYPNVAVYDWAAHARPEWFQSDGIHYTGPGLAQRIHHLADALVDHYPAGR